MSLNLLKILVQRRATFLAQQCCTILASFEQALGVIILIMFHVFSSDSSCYKCPANTVCNSGVCQCRRGYVMDKRNCIRKSAIYPSDKSLSAAKFG